MTPISPRPPIIKGYRFAAVTSHSTSGGMYESPPDVGDTLYTSVVDLLEDWQNSDYLTTEKDDWRETGDAELVAAIEERAGRTYNEPDILVAMRADTGSIEVFGILIQDAYEMTDGGCIEVKAYEQDPSCYLLVGIDNTLVHAEQIAYWAGDDDTLIDPEGAFGPAARADMVDDVRAYADTREKSEGVRPDEQAILGRMQTLTQYRNARS